MTHSDRLRTALNAPPASRVLREEEDGPWRPALFLQWERRSVRALVVILAVLGVVVAWWWMRSPSTPVTVDVPVVAETPSAIGEATVGEVVVHVAGRVERPGVIRLPAGSRIADAIDAAGGALKERDLDSVNLARVLVDGEQIQVGIAATAQESGIDINSASASELEDLPGIGPVLAGRIVEWRTTRGPFTSVDDLGQVEGIGSSVLEELRSAARV